MLAPHDFFDLDGFPHPELFAGVAQVWEALSRIGPWLAAHAPQGRELRGRVEEGAWLVGDGIFLGEGAFIEAGAMVQGPAWLGPGCRVLHGAYVRGNLIAGEGSVIGHATEVKNALFLRQAHAPHFAYVGDSVLGNGVNLGAGTKLSNLAISSAKDPETGRRPTVRIRIQDRTWDTGLEKMGAILGDGVQTGCNSVLNPGTLIGRGTLVYPNASVRGYVGPGRVAKLRQELEDRPRRV